VKKLFFVFYFLSFVPLTAHANWEYGGGYYDDGARMTISIRGGVAMPFAKMQNDLGGLPINYYSDVGSGGSSIVDELYCLDPDNDCTGYDWIGTVDVGALPVAKKYDSFSWAGGAAVGMTISGSPNWRVELDWLHIAESDYSADPLFKGDAETTLGPMENKVATAHATASTDVISAMFYYDFFSGFRKQIGAMIPYIGFGLGYATSATVLALTDTYGDFQNDITLCENFGAQSGGVCNYYTSETETNSFALSGAIGMSYGIDEGFFFDIGARVSFVPKIKWSLNNDADTDPSAIKPKERDIFSAANVMFTSVYAGIRFEF
jgi:hypothetical protein